MAPPSRTVVEVDGHRLTLANLDKVLYPETGLTKAAVVDYYTRIAPAMLPHLRGRALTMIRWPDGVAGPSFFEKRCPPHAPSWIRTAPTEAGVRACVIESRAALVWAANLAALELHTPQARVDAPDRPTAVVVDLDPGPPAGVLDCARVALELRAILERLDLVAVVKTSGAKGLHLSIPVSGVSATETKAWARAVGGLLAGHAPDRVTVVMARDERTGRVLFDWSQNDRAKTTVCAYSLRAGSRPTVSTPVSWDEVSDALDADDPGRLTFGPAEALERAERAGDLYAASVELEQALPPLA